MGDPERRFPQAPKVDVVPGELYQHANSLDTAADTTWKCYTIGDFDPIAGAFGPICQPLLGSRLEEAADKVGDSIKELAYVFRSIASGVRTAATNYHNADLKAAATVGGPERRYPYLPL